MTAEGAADLKKQVEDSLLWRLNATKALGQGLAMDGSVEALPKEAFYEVSLPRLSVLLGPKGKLDIGTVVIQATPGNPGEWQTRMTLPSQMTLYDAAGTVMATVAIGKQRTSGTWLPAKEMYPTLDSLYEDIRIRSADGKSWSASARSLKSIVNMKENADGSWSGPVMFEADGIGMEVAGKNSLRAEVKKVVSSSTYDKLDMSQMLTVRKELQTLFKDGRQPTQEDARAFLKMALARQSPPVDAASSTFEIDGFSASVAGSDAAKPQQQASFDRLAFSGESAGLRQEKSSASTKAVLDGLRLSFVPPDLAGFVPSGISAEISAENLPFRKIMETLAGALQETVAIPQAPENPIAAKNAMAGTAALLPKILQEAGAALIVRSIRVKSENLDSSASGKMEANGGAALGATGNIAVSIKGLDESIGKLQALSIRPDADPQLLGYAGGMTVVQMMGQSGVAADGKTLRNYVFELTPEGKLLLNGTDLKPVAAGLGHPDTVKARTEAAPASPSPSPSPPAPAPAP